MLDDHIGPLSAMEIRTNIKKRFYPGSDCHFVYQKLKELIPITDEIPGTLLFCYDDVIDIEKITPTLTKNLLKN
jgi:hypothetical protein